MTADNKVSPSTGHPWDIKDRELELAMAHCSRSDLLSELIDASRQAFGFFTKHYPHTINYPWVLEHLDLYGPETRVLDAGAGVSPIPLCLARRGMSVDTVDGSPTIRRLPFTGDENEWGFLDYASLDSRLRSFNSSFAAFAPDTLYDAIYSVSVLAHMTRVERDAAVASFGAWLRPGGTLLLAVDLMLASDFIWNRASGVEVAPPEMHGTSDSIVETLRHVGFRIVERSVVRAVHQSRTDLLFIAALRG